MYRHKSYGTIISSEEYQRLSFTDKQRYGFVCSQEHTVHNYNTIIVEDDSPSIVDAIIAAEIISDSYITNPYDLYPGNEYSQDVDFGGGDFGGGGAGDDF